MLVQIALEGTSAPMEPLAPAYQEPTPMEVHRCVLIALWGHTLIRLDQAFVLLVHQEHMQCLHKVLVKHVTVATIALKEKRICVQ